MNEEMILFVLLCSYHFFNNKTHQKYYGEKERKKSRKKDE